MVVVTKREREREREERVAFLVSGLVNIRTTTRVRITYKMGIKITFTVTWCFLSSTRSNRLCLAVSSSQRRPSSSPECTSSGSTSSRTTSSRPT